MAYDWCKGGVYWRGCKDVRWGGSVALELMPGALGLEDGVGGLGGRMYGGVDCWEYARIMGGV